MEKSPLQFISQREVIKHLDISRGRFYSLAKKLGFKKYYLDQDSSRPYYDPEEIKKAFITREGGK